jgi:hypothetical protein
MKMKIEHFNQLREAILESFDRLPFEHGDIDTWSKAWSVVHFAVKISQSNNCHGDSGKVELPLYDYLNDAHIHTAIKKIFPEL